MTHDAPMTDESPSWIEQEERIDHQLVRGIGIPALTANIVSSTIGAGIFVIPATVAKGLGPAAPLAFVCCAIAMVLFVTCFAIAGSRVSLTGGLYAYVEVAFGRYVGFLAGVLYFLTALGAVAGVVNVFANSVALVVPFFDPRRARRSYWPTVEDERLAWRFVKRVLEAPKPAKLFQNGLYDIAFLWRAYGIGVRGAEEDTMLLHHALQPEALKGLGYLGSLYTDEGSWKHMRVTETIKKDE